MSILRGVTGPSQAVQVPDCEFQDVRLFQLAYILTLSLEHTPAVLCNDAFSGDELCQFGLKRVCRFRRLGP
jgi:hypothetical protein